MAISFNLNSNLDPISIYGAFLSTLIAIIGGISWLIKQFSKKVKLRCSVVDVYDEVMGKMIKMPEDQVNFNIINKENYDLQITNICFKNKDIQRTNKNRMIASVKPFIVESKRSNSILHNTGIFSKYLPKYPITKIWVIDATDRKFYCSKKDIKQLNKYILQPIPLKV